MDHDTEIDTGDGVAESVPAMSSVEVPIYALKGALSVVSDEETRPYLSGIYLHRVEGALRVVASDGDRLFVASLERGPDELPDWLEDGVLIPGGIMKPRLAFLNSLKESTALVSFAKGAPNLHLSDPKVDILFRMEPLVGMTFPDYQTVIIDKTHGAFTREVATDFQPVGYSSAYLKDVGAMAKVLASDYVRVFSSTEHEPTVIVFDSAPGCVLYLMPSKVSTPLAPATAKLLEGPIKGTIAALTAHQTRWRNKRDELPTTASDAERASIDEKIEEYSARIAKVIVNASPPSLPTPFESFHSELKRRLEGDYVMFASQVQGWFDDGFTVDQAMEHVEEIQQQALGEDDRLTRINERAALSAKRHKTAARDFLKDSRLALVAGGWTGDLVNAKESDEAFAAGYTVDEFVATVSGREAAAAPSEPGPATVEAFMAEIDQLLAERALYRNQDLLEDTPFTEWFEAGLSPAQALDRGLDAWMRGPNEPETAAMEQPTEEQLLDAAE